MRGRDALAAVVGIALCCGPAGSALAAAGLSLGSLLGQVDSSGFARAERPRPFRFPVDHGPHPRYRSEWWYLTASLESEAGREFGVQFTLFRQALRPQPVIGGPWDASQVYLAHLAVTDVDGQRHLDAERLSRGHPRLAGVSVTPFRAHLDGWTLAASGPDLTGLALDGAAAAFGVHLRMEPRTPIVLQGDRGLSSKGAGQASYYYSVPRLATTGTVRLGDRTESVRGNAWFDREWSTSVLGEELRGWDWFGLQLDSGVELMVYRLRNRRGVRDPHDQGSWVNVDGVSRPLRSQDFDLEPLRWWEDDDGVRWPVAWRLSVMSPSGPRQLEIRAPVDDQRMDTMLTYWEGLVRVFDSNGGRIGAGYMELTGYD